MMANASGRISSRTFSMVSSIFLTSLSCSVARASFWLRGISFSSSALISATRASSEAIATCILSLRAWHLALRSSSLSWSMLLYASSTLSRVGLMAFMSLSAFVPNIFLKTSVNDISYIVLFVIIGCMHTMAHTTYKYSDNLRFIQKQNVNMTFLTDSSSMNPSNTGLRCQKPT